MFLGKGGENEVRLRNGEESAMCLRAFAAPKASGAHSDLGLLNLVPRALRVEFGINKAGQALFLVGLENVYPGNQEDGADSDQAQQGRQPVPASIAAHPGKYP